MSGLAQHLHALRQQIVGEPLPPNRIASGWALGMFVGCFVPFGLQLMVSVPLAFAFRVSKVGASVGTLVTNPVTIFFIYPVQCWVGSRLIGLPLSWDYLNDVAFAQLRRASFFSAEGWQAISDLGVRVLGGFFAGGLLLALILTPITFFVVRRLVVTYRRLRDRKAAA